MSFIHSSSNLLSTQSDEGKRNDIDHHQVFHRFNSLLIDQDLSPLSASSSFSSSSLTSSSSFSSSSLTSSSSFSSLSLTSSSSHSGRNFSSCKSSSSGGFHSRSSENLLTRITSSSSFCNSSSFKKRRRRRPSSTSSSSLLSNSSFHTDDEDEENDGERMRKKVYPFSRSSRMLKMNRIPIQKLFVILLSSFISIISIHSIEGVTVHEVKLLTDSGKSDYAQVGEGVIFSCLYILDPDEVILSIVWEKDKEQVYSHIMGIQQVPIVSGILKGHVDTSNESPSTLVVKNSTIDMQGTFSCHVVSNKSKSQNEIFLIVILDACTESSWETHSDMVSCIEDITFYCRGMFPKPSPVCGIYNDHTGSYIQSVSFDRVEKMEDGTYEISLFRRFFAKDWIKYPGRISFRCFIIVVSTTWRKGIHHKLFGDAGCPQSPPMVSNGYFNLTSGYDRTCWSTPKESSRIRYTCHPGFQLLGPESMICKNGSWKSLPSAKYLLSDENSSLDDEDEKNEQIFTGNERIISENFNYGFSSRQLGFASQAKKFKNQFLPKGPLITVCSSSSGQRTFSSIFFSSSCIMIHLFAHIIIYLLS